MTIRQEFNKLSNGFIREFIKEMKRFSKEELEGLIYCIESDNNVTRTKSNGNICICDDVAICVHLAANLLLRQKA